MRPVETILRMGEGIKGSDRGIKGNDRGGEFN
jgi:hypothetical protein